MTYTPSKFPPAAALVADATYTAVPAAGSSFALTAGSNGTLGTWGATSFTLTKSGVFDITFRYQGTNDAGSGEQTVAIQKNGVTQGSTTHVFRAGGQSADVVGYASFSAVATDVITLVCTAKSGATNISGSGTIEVRFVPTAANPQ